MTVTLSVIEKKMYSMRPCIVFTANYNPIRPPLGSPDLTEYKQNTTSSNWASIISYTFIPQDSSRQHIYQISCKLFDYCRELTEFNSKDNLLPLFSGWIYRVFFLACSFFSVVRILPSLRCQQLLSLWEDGNKSLKASKSGSSLQRNLIKCQCQTLLDIFPKMVLSCNTRSTTPATQAFPSEWHHQLLTRVKMLGDIYISFFPRSSTVVQEEKLTQETEGK